MSAQRCVDSQSKQSTVRPFCPIICMQGWEDRSDSLAKSGQDWPDGLPIRPATLKIELNIVCFSAALVLHRSAVAELKHGGKGGRAVTAAAALFTGCCHDWRTGPCSHAGNLNTVGWLCAPQAHYCYTSRHPPPRSPPEFSWWETEKGWRPTRWAICLSFRFSCDQCVINGECCCSAPEQTHSLREEGNQSYTYRCCDPMWDKGPDAAAVWDRR